MRIACLQFAPQVGDTDNNLNRADAVLAKVGQDDLDSLDLIVLPELAFSGWNFQSPEDIAPYLEPSGSGISSLWARTVALKHNASVLVGYPEKVEVLGHHQAHPEFYNSAILVNGDGETVANYRKTFLYRLDETWADEGQGFFAGQISGLGNTAIGICTDINPYRLEAPWHAFEFAFHILEARASLVIVTMAWLTGENCEHFTQFPDEPDMEALAYWAQRLEPVIRDESRDEIIIVFCNRTGIEGDAVYSGTSAVVGIHQGEVNVYGLLGRGVKDLLVVDTDEAPLANLVLRKERFYLNPLEHESRHDRQGSSSAGSLLLTPLPVGADDRTPTKYLSEESISAYDPESVGRDAQHYKPSSSPSFGAPVAGSPDDVTPTARDPTTTGPTTPQLDISAPRLFSDKVGNKDSSTEHAFLDEVQRPLFTSSQDAEAERTDQAGQPEDSQIPRGPARETGTTPARPSSPKSRNVSRAGRPRRCLSGTAQRQDRGRTSVSPRPELSRSRSASLSSRYPGADDELLGRALDFYLKSIARDAGGDEMVASGDHASRSASTRDGRGLMREDAARPASPYPGCLPSQPGSSASVDETILCPVEDSDVQLSYQQAQAELWREISRLVEEHVGPSESTEDSRGRRRSRSRASTTGAARRMKSGSSPSLSPAPSRDGQVHSRGDDTSRGARRESPRMSTSRQTAPSHTALRDDVPIRSVKDPALGPPSDPDDEIVAEIIFRRPNYATGESRGAPGHEPGAQMHATGNAAPARPGQQQARNETSVRHCAQRPPPDDDDVSEKTPTITRAAAARQDLASLALQTSVQILDDELQAPPHLSAASVHTLSSYEASPVTPPPPPPNSFGLRTPKAMILGLDCPAAAAPPAIDPLAMAWARYPEQSLGERIANYLARPRSALL